MQVPIDIQANVELNNKLKELSHRQEFTIPYHTSGWRYVNFDKPIMLGLEPYKFDDGQPYSSYVGFLSRPKYAYMRWQATQEQSAKIKELCMGLIKDPTATQSITLYDYLQTCKSIQTELIQDQNNQV